MVYIRFLSFFLSFLPFSVRAVLLLVLFARRMGGGMSGRGRGWHVRRRERGGVAMVVAAVVVSGDR